MRFMFPYIDNLLHWNIEIRVPTCIYTWQYDLGNCTPCPQIHWSYPLGGQCHLFSNGFTVNIAWTKNLIPSSLYAAHAMMLWITTLTTQAWNPFCEIKRDFRHYSTRCGRMPQVINHSRFCVSVILDHEALKTSVLTGVLSSHVWQIAWIIK